MTVKSVRRGFMYSLFTIFVVSILTVIVANPMSTDDIQTSMGSGQIDEVYYYMSSIEQDLWRTGRITARRTLSAAANLASDTDESLDNATVTVLSGFRNGTMNGSEQVLLNDTSYEDWRGHMINRTKDVGYDLNITLDQLRTGPSQPAYIYVNATYNVTLWSPNAGTGFTRTVQRDYRTDTTNVTDPLFYRQTDGQYARPFTSCNYDTHAEQHETGTEDYYTDSKNWTSGTTVVRPNNGGVAGISNKNEKVVAVSDVCAYSDSTIANDLSAFKGVVSENASNISDDGSTICGSADSSGFEAYIGGADGISITLDNGTHTVMTEKAVWENNMKAEVENGCYFSDQNGPNFFDRLEGKLSASGSTGWASFVMVSELPSDYQYADRSAIDHLYFPDDASNVKKVKGVTDHYSWFRLDQTRIDRWNLNDLAYD